MSRRLEDISALVADTTGWLEWISPRATTEIAVVYSDGDVYLPTGGTAEEFAFANARGKVHRLVRADDLAALLEFARAVKAFTWASPNGYDPAYDHIRDLLNDLEMP